MPVIGATNECPRYHLDPGILLFSRLARFANQGHLPVAGGVLDQPAHLLEALDFYHGIA